MSKPLVRVYNNTTQTLTATATPLALAGVVVVENAPCVIDATSNSIVVKRTGYYHVVADVIFNATGTGTEEVYFTMNGTVLPCALSAANVAQGNIVTLHIETDVPISACSIIKPQIQLVMEGATGTISHLCIGVWERI